MSDGQAKEQNDKEQELVFYEEDIYEKQKIKQDVIQLVVFRLSTEWYGVDISKTKEVIKVETITYLPSAPRHISGIVNIRGNIFSVTDLKKIFGLPQEGLTENSRLVVIDSVGIESGLLVDEVDEVIEAPLSKIDPALTTITPEKSEYINGEYQAGNKLIGILNINKVLGVMNYAQGSIK